jgi:hypothetical protein
MADKESYTKEELDAAVEAAVGKIDVDGLKSKIEELIGDNKKLKGELRAKSEVKPEDVHAAEERAEKAEAALAEATKQVTSLTKERDKAVKDLEAESGFTQKLLIQDGLKSALIENGVKDADFIDSLTAKFAPTATITIDGDKREAKIGDKALADAIREWAGSESGKKFVAAPANGGGGAPGGDGKGGGKTLTRSAFDALGQAERATFAKEGGKVVDEAA